MQRLEDLATVETRASGPHENSAEENRAAMNVSITAMGRRAAQSDAPKVAMSAVADS
jgi:hypothetical protein